METKDIEKSLSEIDSKSEDVSASSPTDEEAAAKAQELMEIISDPKVLRAYRNVRNGIYGIGERKQVSQKEKKKKKAKRRMAKKSKK